MIQYLLVEAYKITANMKLLEKYGGGGKHLFEPGKGKLLSISNSIQD